MYSTSFHFSIDTLKDYFSKFELVLFLIGVSQNFF